MEITSTAEKQKHSQTASIILLLLLIPAVAAQPGSNGSTPGSGDQMAYARFSPSMAIIIAVLVTALFFMGFFSIYIRRCADTNNGGTVRPILSMRRRAAASRGLSAEVIETFPTFEYDAVKDLNTIKGALECAVCLNEFETNETLRLIPKCDHVFHPECIDAWLASHVTCPVCRANLVPQPGESTQDSDEADSALDNNNQNGEVSIQIPNELPQVPVLTRDTSTKPSFFERFRSHSTGHSLVQPGENMDRFTLRLPADVRKQVIKRALLKRTASGVAVLPREGSSRRGFRSGEGRSYRRAVSMERVVRSERWAKLPSFLSRAMSIKSPKVKGESSLLNSGQLKSDDNPRQDSIMAQP